MGSLNSGCCIDITDGVANERVHARSGVTKAGSIVVERERAGNRVVVTSGVARERFSSVGRLSLPVVFYPVQSHRWQCFGCQSCCHREQTTRWRC